MKDRRLGAWTCCTDPASIGLQWEHTYSEWKDLGKENGGQYVVMNALHDTMETCSSTAKKELDIFKISLGSLNKKR